MTAPLLPEPELTRKAGSRRSPVRLVAVLGTTVIAAGAIAFLAGRGDETPPRLALSTAGSGAEARSSAAMDASMPAGRVTYVIDGTLPNLADQAPVWKVVPTPVDRDRVADWAQLLQVDGGVHDSNTPDAAAWEVSGSDGVLSVSDTGAGTWVSMYRGMPGASVSPGFEGCAAPDSGSQTVDPDETKACLVDPAPEPTPEISPPVALPSAEEAEAVARKLLDGMGVLDGDWTFTVNDGGSIGVATSCVPNTDCGASPSEEYIISRSVVAQRVVDGAAVAGLEWYVEIGDRGKVTNLNGQLGTLERVGDYPLRAPADALRELETNGGGVPVAMGAPEPAIARDDSCASDAGLCPTPPCTGPCPEVQPIVVHITAVSLGAQLWYGSDPSSPTQYVVPTYRFTGHTDSSSEWPVEALALSDDALAPPHPTPAGSTDPAPDTPTSDLPIEPEPEPAPTEPAPTGSAPKPAADLPGATPTTSTAP